MFLLEGDVNKPTVWCMYVKLTGGACVLRFVFTTNATGGVTLVHVHPEDHKQLLIIKKAIVSVFSVNVQVLLFLFFHIDVFKDRRADRQRDTRTRTHR